MNTYEVNVDFTDIEASTPEEALQIVLDTLQRRIPEPGKPLPFHWSTTDGSVTQVCNECGASEAGEDYGMCDSCQHDALRSGWVPGASA